MHLSLLRSRWIPVVLLCTVALVCPVPWESTASAGQSAPLIAQDVWPPAESLLRSPSRHAGVKTQNDCVRAPVHLSQERFEAEGGSGVIQIEIPDNCSVSVITLHPFIRIMKSDDKPGSREFRFTVAANPGPDRTGVILVQYPTFPVGTDFTYTIFQDGGFAGPSVDVVADPLVPANGGKLPVQIKAPPGVSWVAYSINGGPFTYIENGSGTGDGEFDIFFGANTTDALRAAEFGVNDTRHIINQPGGSGCDYLSRQSSIFIDPIGGFQDFDVVSSSSCYFVVDTDQYWVNFEDRVIGPGDTSFRAFIQSNPGVAGRGADFTINNEHFMFLAQPGAGFNPNPVPLTSPTFTGDLTRNDGFSLTGGNRYAESYSGFLNPDSEIFIHLTSASFNPFDTRGSVLSVFPESNFTFRGNNATRSQPNEIRQQMINTLVASNDDNGLSTNARIPPRGRFITLAEDSEYILEVTSSHELETGTYQGRIIERPANCTYTLNIPSQYFTQTGGQGQATVNTQAGCPWESLSQAPWLRITNGGPKTGTGTFNYTSDQNPDTGLRIGEIDIEYAEQTIQIKQYGMGGSNPGASAQLQRDDGTVNTGAAGDNLAVVACLTPPAYPFTATSVSIHMAAFQGQPSPVGKSMQLIGLAAPATGGPLQFSPLLVNRPVTVAQPGFNTYPLTENPTITSGTLCLGVRTPMPFNGVIPSIDTNNSGESWFSRDNANNFTQLLVGAQRTPANLMIRISGMGGVGGACTSLVSPLLARFDSTGGMGMLDLTTGGNCVSSFTIPDESAFAGFNSFFALTSGATGAGSRGIGFEVAPNALAQSRFGLISGGGQTAIVKQGPQLPCPVVSGITPQSARIGRQVDILGDRMLGVGAISFANQLAAPFIIIDDDRVRVTIPDTAASGPLRVTTPGCTPIQTAALNVEQILRPAATVSAANYIANVAADFIAAIFGEGLATQTGVAGSVPLPQTLAGAEGFIRDSSGMEHPLSFFFVSPGQANVYIPGQVSSGLARVRLFTGDSLFFTGEVNVSTIAPGVFSANATGSGPAAALVLRVKQDGTTAFEPVVGVGQGGFMLLPVDLGPETDQVFLVLYGTGVRRRSGLENVSVDVGGTRLGSLFAGEVQGFIGLDQINTVQLPRALAGRGEVDVVLRVDAQTANTVRIAIK